MGKPDAFFNDSRRNPERRPVAVRLRDWREVYLEQIDGEVQAQSSRCMDCGIPFCHQGCPLGNLIPEWNDLVYRGEFAAASERLHQTNNFPEFTGRLCPAPCESACVAGIGFDPVSIERTEYEIAEHAFALNLVVPELPSHRTGRSVAIVGSGPAGLATAQQLVRSGHSVTVYERSERPGGLLRFGIPEFKLEKQVLDRRLDQLTSEGVTFVCNVEIGAAGHPSLDQLRTDFDAVVLTVGSTISRDVPVVGRELQGVHFAMEYLPAANRAIIDQTPPAITAQGKHVVILGGGDTGADCLGTAHRQGALSVTQIELLEEPPHERTSSAPWPTMPMLFKVTSAHEEGGTRLFARRTTEFQGGDRGVVTGLTVETLRYEGGQAAVVGTESIASDLVLIAAGFLGPELEHFPGLPVTARNTIAVDQSWIVTPAEGVRSPVFAAGDAVRGQSLIVWAIAEGRSVAASVDHFLRGGETSLPSPVSPGAVSWVPVLS